MFSGQGAGCTPDVRLGGDNSFVVKCLEVCTCVVVHTVLGDAGANATPDLGIYSHDVPRGACVWNGKWATVCRPSGKCKGCLAVAG